MKSILILICFICSSFIAIKAQTDTTVQDSDTSNSVSDDPNDENERVTYFDLVDENSEHKSLLLYNNPNKLPKFWLNTNLLAMWGWYYGPYFPLSVNMYYRTGNRSYVQLNDVFNAFRPSDMRIAATYNYKLFNTLKHRTVFQFIPGDGKNYSADLPINHYRSLDFGIGPAFDKQSYIGFSAEDMLNTGAVNITRNMVKAGFAWTKSESFWMMLDNKRSGYYRRGRFYFDLYYLLSQNYRMQFNDAQPPGTAMPVPTITKIGYLAGFEKILGIKNSGWAIKINGEFGAPPGFSQKSIGDIGNNTYFLVTFGGICWGPKPKIPHLERLGEN